MVTCSVCTHDCFLEFPVGDTDEDPMGSVLICMDCGTVILTDDMEVDDLEVGDLKRLLVVCEQFGFDR